MKKTVILLLFIALIARDKNINAQVTNNKVLWAENVESTVPLEKPFKEDSADWYNKDNNLKLNWYRSQFTPMQIWNVALKYDKEKMFSSITRAVLSGKLKAYTDLPTPSRELTLKEFNDILVQWDTSDIAMTLYDINGDRPVEAPIGTPIKDELRSDDITQIKFNETIEFDTVSYTLSKKVSTITFYTYETTCSGEIVGQKEIFYVKLNDLPNKQK